MSESRTTTIVVIFLAGGFGAALLTNKEAQIDQPVATVSGDADDVLLNGSVVFQRERNDCGAAVLAMILNRFGRHVTLRELAKKIALSSNGASLQQLKEAANEFGLQAEGWRLSLEDMMRVRYPAILFMSRGHFVVADSVDPSGAIWVRDPAAGVVRLSRESLEGSWGGETLLFSYNDSADASAEKLARRERK